MHDGKVERAWGMGCAVCLGGAVDPASRHATHVRHACSMPRHEAHGSGATTLLKPALLERTLLRPMLLKPTLLKPTLLERTLLRPTLLRGAGEGRIPWLVR